MIWFSPGVSSNQAENVRLIKIPDTVSPPFLMSSNVNTIQKGEDVTLVQENEGLLGGTRYINNKSIICNIKYSIKPINN